jgi:hypothetical protein
MNGERIPYVGKLGETRRADWRKLWALTCPTMQMSPDSLAVLEEAMWYFFRQRYD